MLPNSELNLKFNREAQNVLNEGVAIAARRYRTNFAGTEHLLHALLEQENGATHLLAAIGVDPKRLLGQLERIMMVGEYTREEPAPFTPRMKKVMVLAGEHARGKGCSEIGTEHLLVGLLAEKCSRCVEILGKAGCNLQKIEAAMSVTA